MARTRVVTVLVALCAVLVTADEVSLDGDFDTDPTSRKLLRHHMPVDPKAAAAAATALPAVDPVAGGAVAQALGADAAEPLAGAAGEEAAAAAGPGTAEGPGAAEGTDAAEAAGASILGGNTRFSTQRT